MSSKLVVPAATGATKVEAEGVNDWKTLRCTWYSSRFLPGSPVLFTYGVHDRSAPLSRITVIGLNVTDVSCP